MSAAALEKLRQEAETLTPHERLSLAEYLWETLPDDPEIERAWLEEAQRRSREIDGGTAKLTQWTDLQTELKSHIENRNR